MTNKDILEQAAQNCPYENTECAMYKSGFIEGYIKCLKDLKKYEEIFTEDNLES